MQRRQFLTASATIAVTSSAFSLCDKLAFSQTTNAPDYPIAIFGKVFQTHSYSQLADVLEATNADGVEATIRGGGHIDPNKPGFASSLAKMVSTLEKRGKRLLIAATDINEASKDNQQLLRIMADHGVKHYRMGYYRYDVKQTLIDQAKKFAVKAAELAQFNRELGIIGLYQNHAGKDYVGNLLWDLAIVLQDVPVQDMGIALDLRHLRAEIGGSYYTAVNAIRPHLRSVYLKDTRRVGKEGLSLEETALGKGMVNRELFQDVFKSVQPVPLSVHVEYHGQKPYAPGKDAIVIDAYKNDLATLRSWMS